MKTILAFLICLFFSGNAFSQTLKDSSFRQSKGVVWKGKTENGKMTGQWQLIDKKHKQIRAITFYENGLKAGEHTYYQSNGKLQVVYHYYQGKLEGKTTHFTPETADTLGVIDYKNGLVHGNWLIYNWKGELLQTIRWTNGVPDKSTTYNKLTTITPPHIEPVTFLDDARKYIGLYYENRTDFAAADSSNKEKKQIKDEEETSFANEFPMFPGGETHFFNYLLKNINYPLSVKERGIYGVVKISFLVKSDGRISVVGIPESVPQAPELSGEVVRVISQMPLWTPGKLNGRIVTVKIVITVRFTKDGIVFH